MQFRIVDIPNPKVVDIKQAYNLREAFSLFDYSDVNIQYTKHQLMRACIHPALLHKAEGRKLLSYIFRMDPVLVPELTAAMKQQVKLSYTRCQFQYAQCHLPA